MTTIHESGHAIAVKLVNWQLTSFNSAGFSARFTHWRWKYSYSFHGLWHGSVGFIPYTPLRFRHKLRIIALGGPFANLVTTFFAFTLSAHLANGYFKSFLAALASWSLLIGVLNLLPCKFGRAEWDGYIAFRGLRTQEWHRAKLASMMLARATLDGVDHLLWNQRWFSLTKPTGKPYLQQVQPLFLHYANFHSSNQPEHAAEMLEHALSVSSRGSEPLRRLLYVQAAYFHAVWRRDYDKAVAWMGRIEKPALVEPYMQLSLDAALAWSRNDFAKFEALTAQGRAAVLALPPSKMRDQQIIEWDRETERLRRIAEPHKPIGTEAAQA